MWSAHQPGCWCREGVQVHPCSTGKGKKETGKRKIGNRKKETGKRKIKALIVLSRSVYNQILITTEERKKTRKLILPWRKSLSNNDAVKIVTHTLSCSYSLPWLFHSLCPKALGPSAFILLHMWGKMNYQHHEKMMREHDIKVMVSPFLLSDRKSVV